MKTVLFLAPYLPFPPNSGGRIDMWGQIQYLRQCGVQVQVACCHTPQARIKQQQDFELAPTLELPVHFLQRDVRWQHVDAPETVAAFQAIIDEVQPQIIWSAYADFAPLVAAANAGTSKRVFRPINFELGHYLEKRTREDNLNRGGWRLRFYRWRRFLRQHG
ncbi:MAG: hypothetical protein KC496_14430, partial [Anaerolineae bacterium]|nr:hypothetical protein [Anaerolineae bacterium]